MDGAADPDTIAGYIEGLLDEKEFKQATYALDRHSRKAALARFLRKAAGDENSTDRLAARLSASGAMRSADARL